MRKKRIDTKYRRAFRKILSELLRVSGPLSKKIVGNTKSQKKKTALVFIVGVPRTGSTLLYQIITNYLNVTYNSNISNLFYHYLPAGILLHDKFYGDMPHDSFENDNGRTLRWNDVNESGKFWYRWYPKNEVKLDDNILNKIDFSDMVSELRTIETHFGHPLIFKNQQNCQRVKSLIHLFDESLFIHISRNPFDTALSIIKQRKRFYNDEQHWYSLKSENYSEIKKLHFSEQVVHQIHAIDKAIERDLKTLPVSRKMKVSYEDLCTSSDEVVKEVYEFIDEKVGIDFRTNFLKPDLKKRNTKEHGLHQDDINRIKHTIGSLKW